MSDQIPDDSDNACSDNLEVPNPQQNALPSTYPNVNGAGIASDLEKQLEYIAENCNKVANNETNDYNIVRTIVMEKVQLLVELTHPINSKLNILTKFEKMLNKLLQQFNQLLNLSDEYLKAYAAHCDQAVVTANKGLESNTAFDQYVHMDFDALLNLTKNMDIQRKELQAATAVVRDQLEVKQSQYQKEYTSVRNESQILQRYEMDAHETVEQIKFDVQRRRRKVSFNN